jgi:hypothetical protein
LVVGDDNIEIVLSDTFLYTPYQVYGSSVNGSIRHKCLSVIAKLMYYSSAEMIEILLGTTNISRFLYETAILVSTYACVPLV